MSDVPQQMSSDMMDRASDLLSVEDVGSEENLMNENPHDPSVYPSVLSYCDTRYVSIIYNII